MDANDTFAHINIKYSHEKNDSLFHPNKGTQFRANMLSVSVG